MTMPNAQLQKWLDDLKVQIDDPRAPPRVRSLSTWRDDLAQQLSAAAVAGDAVKLAATEDSVRQLWVEVENAGRAPASGWRAMIAQAGAGGVASVVIVFVSVVLLGVLLNVYFASTPAETLRTVDGMRPLLVLTAILATIGLGGGLVFSALFSNEGPFENRFRMAREIFLVFSGVFGTVVGFHFGQAETDKVVTLDAADPKYADGRLEFKIVGGQPPYIARVRVDGREHAGSGPSPVDVPVPDVPAEATKKLVFTVSDMAGRTKTWEKEQPLRAFAAGARAEAAQTDAKTAAAASALPAASRGSR